MKVVLAVLIFGGLVFIHEFGHFITARMFGITVREFAIGMGPTLWRFEGKPNAQGVKTKYALRLLPIGGFVSMEGEEESSTESGAFCNKPVWQRMIVVSAGAITNLLAGVICMTILVCAMPRFGGTTVGYADNMQTAPITPLADGDKILSVGGTNVHIDYDLMYTIMRKGTEPVDIVIERDGQVLTLHDVVFPTEEKNGMLVGTIDFRIYVEERTFASVAKHAYWRSVGSIRMVIESVGDLLTGRLGMEAISGPVGVAGVISDAANDGVLTVLSIVGLIALNLGVMNLLPFPALDGGKLAFLLVELCTKKKVKPEVEGAISFVGLALLMGLMLIVTFRDVMNLF